VKVVTEVTLVQQDLLGQLDQVESKVLLGNKDLQESEARLVQQDQLDRLDQQVHLARLEKEETLVL